MDMNDIMSNLYGPTATQMLGGAAAKKTSSSSSSVENVAYPEYVKNAGWNTFMKEFYQIKRVVHSYSAAIYIIPEDKELAQMVTNFKNELKKAGIEEGSEEAFKYAATKDLPYKRCIFSVFADSTSDNYRLDAIAAYKKFGIIKRTNMLNEQFYFKYVNEKVIKICPEKDSDKGGSDVRLIANCNNGIYIFKGNLPKATMIYQRTVKGGNLSGGAKKKVSRKHKFRCLKHMIERYGVDEGAERFLSGYSLHSGQTQKFANVFSGDLLHSAFRVCFNDEFDEDALPSVGESLSDIREETQHLCDQYKPINKNFNIVSLSNKFADLYSSIAKRNLSAQMATKMYTEGLKSKYNKLGIDMLKADIATSLIRNGYYDDLKQIWGICEDCDDAEKNKSGLCNATRIEFSDESNESFGTSKLNSVIHDAISSAPLIGLNAKTYYPNLKSFDVRRVASMMGGLENEDESDENNNEDIEPEVNYEMQSLGDEIEAEVNAMI